jgi:hypothetical protein
MNSIQPTSTSRILPRDLLPAQVMSIATRVVSSVAIGFQQEATTHQKRRTNFKGGTKFLPLRI